MANVSGQGTVWNLPNYVGELFTADEINTPFLTMIGGMGGGQQTANFQFPIDSEYEHEAASQPAITETASLAAPTAIGYTRAQTSNVTQIFMEAVSISYARLSNQGRLSGLNTAGDKNPVVSEKDFQIAKALEKIARDIEYTCLNGAYNLAANAGQANKTRGMIELCSTGSTVAASSARLTKAMVDSLLKEMFDNGAVFKNPVMWVNSFQKQMISDIYGYAPTDRNVGGVNVQTIETDFGVIGVKLNRFMPAATLLVADMAAPKPVFQPVPEKGNFFYEELSKVGASENGQIFGQFGLNHGDITLHGTVTGLATA